MSRLALLMRRSALLVAAVSALGCSSRAEAPAADGGSGGGGGAPVEGCIDITGNDLSLLEPMPWQAKPVELPRQPFWVDDRGVHFLWTSLIEGSGQIYLLVTSFDADTGEPWASRVYDPYPPELSAGATGIQDVAGAPDGSFAVSIGYQDETDPYGHVQRILLGHLDQAELVATVQPPWSEAEASIFHLGWDGEAFAIHALNGGASTVRLLRLAPDGTVVTPETEVGQITSFWEVESDFHTDAASGRSWMLTSRSLGVWLSGHDRQGTPLAGTEADGGVALVGQGDWPCNIGDGATPAVASNGVDAMLGWSSYSSPGGEVCLQPVTGAEPKADAIALADGSATGTRKTLVRTPRGWWMALLRPGVGIESYWLGPTGVLSRDPLVPYTRCSPTCVGPQQNILRVALLNAVPWAERLWFGFSDETDCYGAQPEHPDMRCPYRVLLVKDGCQYATTYELNNPR